MIVSQHVINNNNNNNIVFENYTCNRDVITKVTKKRAYDEKMAGIDWGK